MQIPFEKWHGCRNDFVIAWLNRSESELIVDSLRRQASRICAKDGSGIGADGILVLVKPDRKSELPEELIVINPDGSLAKNCGNGLRCAAGSVVAYLQEHSASEDAWQWVELRIAEVVYPVQTLAQRQAKDSGAKEYFFSIAFNAPCIEKQIAWHPAVEKEIDALIAGMGLETELKTRSLLELGNPHLVIFVDALDQKMFERVGSALQQLKAIDGINVHFAAPASVSVPQFYKQRLGVDAKEHYDVLSWERGVGPTAACGSGASCVAAAAYESEQALVGEWVRVHPPGGDLFVLREADAEGLKLVGPATMVFKGSLEI